MNCIIKEEEEEEGEEIFLKKARLKEAPTFFRGCDKFRHSAKNKAKAQRCSGRIFIMRGWGCRSLYYSIAGILGRAVLFQEADVVSDNGPENWDITCLKLSNECPKGITDPRSPYFFMERIII